MTRGIDMERKYFWQFTHEELVSMPAEQYRAIINGKFPGQESESQPGGTIMDDQNQLDICSLEFLRQT
jgi:hypothetical protein